MTITRNEQRAQWTDERVACALDDAQWIVYATLRANDHAHSADTFRFVPYVRLAHTEIVRALDALHRLSVVVSDGENFYASCNADDDADVDDGQNDTENAFGTMRYSVFSVDTDESFACAFRASVRLHLISARSIADALNENALMSGSSARYFARRMDD